MEVNAMRVEAIYDKGRLEFLAPIRFIQERFQVRVEVPKQVIDQQSAPDADHEDLDDYARDLVARLDAIRNAPPPPDELLPRFSQKQQERLQAFALRDEIKKGK